ncbi:MAG: CoA transferase [Pseudomonadota bacterium]|nr:CoA transferase [Pseudomonadota bacterium]
MLAGLKVVELATYIAAPGAGAILADWGAEVIKVEAPAGDPIRNFFDGMAPDLTSNPVFETDNRGKRGIVLDVTKPEGREALLRLIREADVFLTNTRPAALKRARLDYDSLAAENPRLIYGRITGFGANGPDADKPGFDIAAFWARSGVASLTAPKGQEPFPIRTGMGDHTASLALVGVILAGVVERSRTGKGRLVETSLLRAGTYAIASDMAIQLRLGRVASTRPRHGSLNPISNFFKTSDGRWVCLVPRHGSGDWTNLVKALGRPDIAADERFATSSARRKNAAVLVDALDEAFAALTFAQAAAQLDALDMVWSPVQTPAEVVADPQAQAGGCFTDMPDGEGGQFRIPAAPGRFSEQDPLPRSAAPTLGEHTDAVLAEAGYTAAEIEALRTAGVAG